MGAITDASRPEPGKAVALASLEAAKMRWSSALSGKGSKHGAARAKSMVPGSLAPQGGEERAGFRLEEIPTKITERCSLSSMAGCGAAYAKLSGRCGRRRARLRLAQHRRKPHAGSSAPTDVCKRMTASLDAYKMVMTRMTSVVVGPLDFVD